MFWLRLVNTSHLSVISARDDRGTLQVDSTNPMCQGQWFMTKRFLAGIKFNEQTWCKILPYAMLMHELQRILRHPGKWYDFRHWPSRTSSSTHSGIKSFTSEPTDILRALSYSSGASAPVPVKPMRLIYGNIGGVEGKSRTWKMMVWILGGRKHRWLMKWQKPSLRNVIVLTCDKAPHLSGDWKKQNWSWLMIMCRKEEERGLGISVVNVFQLS